MPAYHLRRTLEHADGRCGLAFASDRLEADDAEAAIRRARDLCRTAANMLLTGAVLTDSLRPDPVVVHPGAGPGAALRPADELRAPTEPARIGAPCNARGPRAVVPHGRGPERPRARPSELPGELP